MQRARYNQVAALAYNYGTARQQWFARHNLSSKYLGHAIYDASGNALDGTFGQPLVTVAGTGAVVVAPVTTGQVASGSPGTFTDNTVNFTTSGVAINDWIHITISTNYRNRWFRITAVTDAHNLVVEDPTGALNNQPFTVTETSIKYEIARSYYLKADFGAGNTQAGYLRLW
jgi:hypothetical protein